MSSSYCFCRALLDDESSLFKCIVCGEDVCGKCRTWIFNSIAMEFGRCLKGHFTRKTMLTDRNFSITQGKCRNCLNNLTDVSIFCNVCNADQCENCFNFIHKVIKEKIESNLQRFRYNALIRFWITAYLDFSAASLLGIIFTAGLDLIAILNFIISLIFLVIFT